jgi:hypothetical protein
MDVWSYLIVLNYYEPKIIHGNYFELYNSWYLLYTFKIILGGSCEDSEEQEEKSFQQTNKRIQAGIL